MEENKITMTTELNKNKSDVKKHTKLIIIGAIVAAIMGLLVYSIYHKYEMDRVKSEMEASSAEIIHNISTRKEVINNDLESFKSLITNMDVKMVDSNAKVDIIASINSLNEDISNSSRDAVLEFENLTNIITESGAYISTDDYENWTDKFAHIIETMVRMNILDVTEVDALAENLDDAFTTMISNGIIKQISDLK